MQEPGDEIIRRQLVELVACRNIGYQDYQTINGLIADCTRPLKYSERQTATALVRKYLRPDDGDKDNPRAPKTGSQ